MRWSRRCELRPFCEDLGGLCDLYVGWLPWLEVVSQQGRERACNGRGYRSVAGEVLRCQERVAFNIVPTLLLRNGINRGVKDVLRRLVSTRVKGL